MLVGSTAICITENNYGKLLTKELSKKDTNMTKGLAIILMVTLHLFCRTDNLPYECLMTIKGVPLTYYFGLFSDCCVAIYCFCSGYALQLISTKYNSYKDYYKSRVKSVLKFLMNFWMVLIIFSIVGLIFDKSGTIPSSVKEFLGNFFLYDLSYNGAWWFVLTYILLVLLSRPLSFVISKMQPIIVNIVVLGIYFVAYVQRFKEIFHFDIRVLDWSVTQLALLGTSILPFVWGMYFYKYKIFSRIRDFVQNHFKNWQIALISGLMVLAMIVGHGIVPSLIIAPFKGTITIVLFNIVNKGKYGNAYSTFLATIQQIYG